MRVLFLEPFYGGSHRYFADSWMARSRHEYTLRTLPARHWKWRQTGSALYFSEMLDAEDLSAADAVVLGGMCDLAHLKALRPELPPVLLYVHENQFAYPVSGNESRDYRYGITDTASMLAAESVVFNSEWNRDSFLLGLQGLLSRLPDAVPKNIGEAIRSKSRIIPPGIDAKRIAALPRYTTHMAGTANAAAEPPLVIWNHRHEHDKAPEVAFGVLEKLARDGIPFRLALLGERFKDRPPVFHRIRETLSHRIVVDDFPARSEYLDWLCRGAVVLSSAIQENFGISAAEAVAAGCLPLLPRRLAYPELIPEEFHPGYLWEDEEDFEEKLRSILADSGLGNEREDNRRRLSESMMRFDWSAVTESLDTVLEEMR